MNTNIKELMRQTQAYWLVDELDELCSGIFCTATGSALSLSGAVMLQNYLKNTQQKNGATP